MFLERCILTIILACFLLFEKSWVVGGSILLMSIFIFGGIGQGLKHNKTKSISGLLLFLIGIFITKRISK
jgi:hypothetical protein